MSQYKILTDATADISAALLEQIQVDMIPMEFDMDGEAYSFCAGEGYISTKEFYQELQKGKVARTSQINPTVYESYFETYLKQGLDVLYICFSSGLSGTIQGAMVCADQLLEKYPDRKIRCIDSLCAAPGEGMLVYCAALKQREGMPFDDLCDWLEENKLRLCHWFTVDDLRYLYRGGRLSAGAAIMGTALQIKPVLHVDEEGHLVNVFKTRGRKKSLSALVQQMQETWMPELGKTVFIGHGDVPEDALQVKAMVEERCPGAEVSIFNIGPIVGAHTGPEIVALFFWGAKR